LIASFGAAVYLEIFYIAST